VTSATPYSTQTHSDGVLPFPGYYWPAIDQYLQSHGSGIAGWENSSTNTAALEVSAMDPIANSATRLPVERRERAIH